MFHDIDDLIDYDIKKSNVKEQKFEYTLYYKNYLLSILPDYLETVNDNYMIDKIFCEDNKILFFSNDDKITDSNIISIIVYKKYICSPTNIHYLIFLLGTNNNVRKCGYGSYILQEFFKRIKIENSPDTKISIVLESVESSVQFYKSIGFNQIKKLKKYSHFFDVDKKDEEIKKNTMLMEYFL